MSKPLPPYSSMMSRLLFNHFEGTSSSSAILPGPPPFSAPTINQSTLGTSTIGIGGYSPPLSLLPPSLLPPSLPPSTGVSGHLPIIYSLRWCWVRC